MAPYADGTVVAWGSDLQYVYKVSVNPGKPRRLARLGKTGGFNLANAITGAYTVLDKDNRFYVPGAATLYAYTDAEAGRADSTITLARQFTLPAEALHSTPQQDPIVGLNMTYDGWLVLATKLGTVSGVVRIEPQ